MATAPGQLGLGADDSSGAASATTDVCDLQDARRKSSHHAETSGRAEPSSSATTLGDLPPLPPNHTSGTADNILAGCSSDATTGGRAARSPPQRRPRGGGGRRGSLDDGQPPAEFCCPIAGTVMRDPVRLPTGHTYERESIREWFARGNGTCPLTRAPATEAEMEDNEELREAIRWWAARQVQRMGSYEHIDLSSTPIEVSQGHFLVPATHGQGALPPRVSTAGLIEALTTSLSSEGRATLLRELVAEATVSAAARHRSLDLGVVPQLVQAVLTGRSLQLKFAAAELASMTAACPGGEDAVYGALFDALPWLGDSMASAGERTTLSGMVGALCIDQTAQQQQQQQQQQSKKRSKQQQQMRTKGGSDGGKLESSDSKHSSSSTGGSSGSSSGQTAAAVLAADEQRRTVCWALWLLSSRDSVRRRLASSPSALLPALARMLDADGACSYNAAVASTGKGAASTAISIGADAIGNNGNNGSSSSSRSSSAGSVSKLSRSSSTGSMIRSFKKSQLGPDGGVSGHNNSTAAAVTAAGIKSNSSGSSSSGSSYHPSQHSQLAAMLLLRSLVLAKGFAEAFARDTCAARLASLLCSTPSQPQSQGQSQSGPRPDPTLRAAACTALGNALSVLGRGGGCCMLLSRLPWNTTPLDCLLARAASPAALARAAAMLSPDQDATSQRAAAGLVHAVASALPACGQRSSLLRQLHASGCVEALLAVVAGAEPEAAGPEEAATCLRCVAALTALVPCLGAADLRALCIEKGGLVAAASLLRSRRRVIQQAAASLLEAMCARSSSSAGSGGGSDLAIAGCLGSSSSSGGSGKAKGSKVKSSSGNNSNGKGSVSGSSSSSNISLAGAALADPRVTPLVIGLLQNRSPSLVAKAARLLLVLCRNAPKGTPVPDINDDNAVRSLLRLLDSADDKQRRMAAELLKVLVASETNRMYIIKVGGVHALLEALSRAPPLGMSSTFAVISVFDDAPAPTAAGPSNSTGAGSGATPGGGGGGTSGGGFAVVPAYGGSSGGARHLALTSSGALEVEPLPGNNIGGGGDVVNARSAAGRLADAEFRGLCLDILKRFVAAGPYYRREVIAAAEAQRHGACGGGGGGGCGGGEVPPALAHLLRTAASMS